jgi:proline iminopeptidase
MKRLLSFAVFVSLIMAGTLDGESESLKAHSGSVEVPGGEIWYRVDGGGEATPLLIIHGGPGIPSYYLNSLAILADERPVVFYDQLGAGRSSATTDTSQWNFEHFIEEINLLRNELELDEVHLFGHSWGSTLASKYVLTRPEGIRSVILAGPALNFSCWESDVRKRLAEMDDSIQALVASHEKAGTFMSPEFQALKMAFYQEYLARTEPWPIDLDSAMLTMNPHLYSYMVGPNPFAISGKLADFDITSRLPEIEEPILIMIGEYDEVLPSTAEYYATRFPDARVIITPDAGHLMFIDNPEAVAASINKFLSEVESDE